jgi:hypothetical protein
LLAPFDHEKSLRSATRHLFFAAGACNYGDNYSLAVATGSSIASGSLTKSAQPLLGESNGGGPFNAYGHGAVVQDPYGGFWFVFHSYQDVDPACPGPYCGLERKLLVQKLRYDRTVSEFRFDHASAIAGPADVPAL